MGTVIRSLAVGVVATLLLSAVLAQGGGQDSPAINNTQLLRDLLSEVRLLRKSVEEAQSSTYRGLLAIERVRLQQEQVDRLSRQLSELKREQMNLNAHLPPMQERIKAFESQIENERDPARRVQLESEFTAFRNLVELESIRHQQQQELEQQLTGQLQAGQAKLNELNDRLQVAEKTSRR
jgi:hypothetical protein